ncbi:alpha/beta hydrolase family protein [Steroidobacter sp.]|uniref:S9 family peptidase n=1 Tax=Steroidobacter sp. TaxID=1978227 RepID=UPI001A4BC699|nr:S9 family peptidase [Steroidobacter sp.]MBL8265619.1 S9 family peptidase [Steroidobacter sp.]
MRSAVFVSLLLVCIGAGAAGLTPEASLKLRTVADAALSPAGSEVAYRLERHSSVEGRSVQLGSLWLVDTKGGEPVEWSESGVSPAMPRWSPDGRTLAWLARREAGAPRQIYVRRKNAAGWGGVIQLTEPRGEVTELQWSPDGQRIAFLAMDAESDDQRSARESGRDWWVADADPARSRLYTVAVDTRDVATIDTGNLNIWSFAWSPSGDAFALVASTGSTDDDRCLHAMPYVVAATGGTPKLIAKTQGLVGRIDWTADARNVLWLGSVDVTDPRDGSVFLAAADGSSAPKNLTRGYEGTVISAVPVPGRSNTLALIAEEGAQTSMRTLDLASGRMQSILASTEILRGSASFSKNGETFAVVASSPAHPEEIFVGRRDGRGGLRRLTYSNPALNGLTLGSQEVTRWRSKDGTVIEGVVIKPVGFVPGVRYPTVIHVHGGSEMSAQNGWNGFGLQEATNLGQVLAARGYLVLFPNYRGSSGRGVDFIRGNRRDLMGREWEDIESGLDHLIELGLADAQRAGIYGMSWGGYAAAWGATWGSHRFKAAVAASGIYNWVSEAGTSSTRMHEQLAHWDEPLYENFELYLNRSPIYQIRKAKTPVLLLHGERDASCPLTQATEFHTALKWAGVPVELVVYPRQGHYLTERSHQLDYMERSAAWFDRYLSSGPRGLQ